MAEHVLRTFAQCKVANRSALVAYIAAGYPSAEETPDILLGMEAGGAGEYMSLWACSRAPPKGECFLVKRQKRKQANKKKKN